jgi:hypothetical protein
MIRAPIIQMLIFVVYASAIIGCGPSRRPTIPTVSVSGTVKVDGQPLDGADVNFLGPEYAGVATTDASGQYSLEAQTGENTVYIVKYVGVDPDFDETMVDTSDMPGVGPKQLLPKKYSDADETELRFNVPEEGATDANFDVTSR